jgi:hypothetical protein
MGVPGVISQILSTADIMLIVVGVGLLLLGGLMATIYTGVSSMVTKQFSNLTGTTVTDYTQTVATYVPTILNMLGLTLIIVAVGHIIYTLLVVMKQGTGGFGVPAGT